MANRETHRKLGCVTGAVYAAHRAKDQKVGHLITESIGGIAGGDIGALIADWIEPATSSWHRETAHSCAAGGLVLSLAVFFAGFEAACREQAERKAKERRALEMTPDPMNSTLFAVAPASPFEQIWLTICEAFWRLFAGFANGLRAGYISHLVLDAGTPRSIPLLTKGF